MKAIVIDSPGGAEKLKIGEVLKPEPKENEILVKVEATALNRADILQREGKYPPPKGASNIIGLEMAGTIVDVGSNANDWKTGDKVFGLIPGGGYGEYAVINKDMAMKIPNSLKSYEATAIPEVFLTAYQATLWYGKLTKGKSILIHAGASGVGTAAIQIAREIGAHIYVTASDAKQQSCINLGAEKAINYKTQDFEKEILNLTDNKGVDVIIDFIMGPYFQQNINSLSTDGRLVILATLGGGKVENLDMRKILIKRLTIIGSTLRSRSLDYQIKLTNEFKEHSLEKFESGKFKPVIDKIFDWKDVSEAHKYMEQNKNIGKIVLKIS